MRYRTLEPGKQDPKDTVRAIVTVRLHELAMSHTPVAVCRCENAACPVPELVVRYDFRGRERQDRQLVCPVCRGLIEQTRVVRLMVLVPEEG